MSCGLAESQSNQSQTAEEELAEAELAEAEVEAEEGGSEKATEAEEELATAPMERATAQGTSSPPTAASAPPRSIQAKPSQMDIESDKLATWLVQRAGVGPKYLDAVMATCDDQMIDSVKNLATLQRAGLLGSMFKLVVAASIEEALGHQGD